MVTFRDTWLRDGQELSVVPCKSEKSTPPFSPTFYMSIFPEDKHLEVYMKSNKAPDKSPSSTTIICISLFLSIPISVTFSLKLFEEIFGIENTFNFHFDEIRDSNHPFTPPSEPPESSGVENGEMLSGNDNDIEYGIPFDPYRISIVPSCNGFNVVGAEFRMHPSSSGSVIQGLVLPDQWVSLTGVTAYESGIIWFQAVNESELIPSTKPNANNQLAELQLGWVQDCFVREAGYPS